MDSSARFVVILSPDFLNDTWCDFALNVALEREKNIVFIIYREIKDWEEFKNQKLMKSIVSIKRKLKWPKKQIDRKLDTFYKKLQLQLPPSTQPESHNNSINKNQDKSKDTQDIVIDIPALTQKANTLTEDTPQKY